MAKPWGGTGTIGAWAADVEREEAEEREAAAAHAAEPDKAELKSFPRLQEVVNTKSKKKKTTMSLSEFTTGKHVGPGGASRWDTSMGDKGLTLQEKLHLPTAPKPRSAEEMQHDRLGGGFSSYGRSSMSSGRMGGRDGDAESSWNANRQSYGGFDEDRRSAAPPRVSDFDMPSRADEVDNWAASKKSIPMPAADSLRQNRYSSLGGGAGESSSMADELDNWSIGKKQISTRKDSFGSGFRDSGREPDRWSRDGLRDVERERRSLVLDPPRREVVNEQVKINRPNPFGDAKPREEVLAQKGLDWKKLDSEIDAKKTSRPTSSHSSRPSSAQSTRSDNRGPLVLDAVAKPRPKVNPFGDAKPREVSLEEKGKDWRKIDFELEHRGVHRAETEAEKNLKEEIEQLKKKLEKENPVDADLKSNHDQKQIQNLMIQKENELEHLIRDLDDKVRFRPRSNERPGSGAGRVAGFPERPPSHSGSFEESRSVEIMELPQSHGNVDAWTRSGGDRILLLRGRDSRETDRPRSRERW